MPRMSIAYEYYLFLTTLVHSYERREKEEMYLYETLIDYCFTICGGDPAAPLLVHHLGICVGIA
jgi:hypothetical protein